MFGPTPWGPEALLDEAGGVTAQGRKEELGDVRGEYPVHPHGPESKRPHDLHQLELVEEGDDEADQDVKDGDEGTVEDAVFGLDRARRETAGVHGQDTDGEVGSGFSRQRPAWRPHEGAQDKVDDHRHHKTGDDGTEVDAPEERGVAFDLDSFGVDTNAPASPPPGGPLAHLDRIPSHVTASAY